MTLGTVHPMPYTIKRKKRVDHEGPIHRSIVGYLGRALVDCPFHHSPNEGNRGGEKGDIDGARRKAMGVLSGWPDLVLCPLDAIAGRVLHGIEVKSERGVLTPEQKAVRDMFMRLKWPYAVCRSVDDVRDALELWGIPTREVC